MSTPLLVVVPTSEFRPGENFVLGDVYVTMFQRMFQTENTNNVGHDVNCESVTHQISAVTNRAILFT